ncbi:hypothetical protein CEDDRAFT_00952 [Frankia sp. CeD]|nr:hypothetical protein CEDDRAFT_00952 [Frankia sp. CeD]
MPASAPPVWRWHVVPSKYLASASVRRACTVHGAFWASKAAVMVPASVMITIVAGDVSTVAAAAGRVAPRAGASPLEV